MVRIMKRLLITAALVVLPSIGALAQSMGPPLPTWGNSNRPTNPQLGRCGFNTDLNQPECYNPGISESQFDAAKGGIYPGAADNNGTIIHWNVPSVLFGPIQNNPNLPGGPYGSNAITVMNGTIGGWNPRLYGWSHSAASLCLLAGFTPPANLNDSQGSCIVAGGYGDSAAYPNGSGAAWYTSRDVVSIGNGIYSPPALWTDAAIVATGDTHTNTTVDNLSINTSNLAVGMQVSGTNIPGSTVVTQINSASSITISKAATGTTGGGSLSFQSNLSSYFAGTFTATTFTPTTPINFAGRIRVGMVIDTNDSPAFSGIISSWTVNGSNQITSITVPGWFQQTAPCVFATPNLCVAGTPSGSAAAINRQIKIFGQNTAITLNTASEAIQATGNEYDCNNNTGIDNTVDTMQNGTTVPYVGCVDLTSFGSNRAAYGSIVRGKFVTAHKLENDSTYGIRMAPIGSNVIGTGISIEQSGGGIALGYGYRADTTSKEALRIWDNGGDIFTQFFRAESRFGRQKTTATNYTQKFWSAAAGNNDGTNPDVSIVYSGGAGNLGGTMTISANAVTTSTLGGGVGVQLNNASVQAVGATNQSLILSSKGAANILLQTNTLTDTQVIISPTASATERITMTGATTGGDPVISTGTGDAQTPHLQITSTGGNVRIGAGGALATTATVGFLMIQTMAGTPTGSVTTSAAGKAAIVVDTTNKKICYNASGGTTWECSAAFTP